ncbi:bacteriophage CI repressor [Salmonella enterica]|nr:bacteriophage CI repressor [Salmonella enterica]ELD6311838.1 helix-turn-helix domain-containing protein [Salmonella enterica]
MHENFSDFSLVGEGKENFKARLQKLIGTRSVRAAASDWGVPVSTLNNYLHKGTEPSFKVVCLISNKEHVSLNWLAYGQDEATKSSLQPMETAGNDHNDLANELLRRAQSADKEKLVDAICDIGIKGILNKLQQSDEGVTGQAEREYTNKELEAMIMALPVRESLKTAFARGVTAGEAADREILRILESHERGVSPGSVPDATETPDPSLKQKAG